MPTACLLEFFQTDRETGRAKDIVAMDEPRMIKNERLYRITKNQMDRFSRTLASLKRQPAETKDVHPLIAKAQEDALKSQLVDLEKQLQEYESLKAGHFDLDALNAVAELPTGLIKTRIAQGLRQKDLGGAARPEGAADTAV